ncbi:hypothetical protein J6K35_05505 [bacterium]|nr:hypothetical protein [bacterium]
MTYNFTTKQFNKHREEIEDIYNLSSLLKCYIQYNLDSDEIYKILSVIKIIVNKLDTLVLLLDNIQVKHSEVNK